MKKVIQSSAAENKKLTMVWVAAGLALLAAGCTTTKEPEVGLLGPRPVVPAPYTQPKAAPQPAVATEPAVPATLTPATETPAVEAPAKVTPPEVKSAITTYKVKAGDSFWKIAQAHGVSDKQLAEFNNMKLTDKLHVGKTLNIPPGGKVGSVAKHATPKHAATAASKTGAKTGATTEVATAKKSGEPIPADGKYTVQKNDNLWTIARKFNVKSADIRSANTLKTDKLEIGQVLTIPQGTGTVAPAAGTAPATPAATGTGTTPPEAVAPAGEMATPPGAPVAEPPTPGTAGTGEGAAKAPAAANTLPHVVVQNETLESIADMYDTKPEEILKANPQIKGNADLKPNMTLQIPFK